jgi:CDP-diacylglycerol pyrophosphatase
MRAPVVGADDGMDRPRAAVMAAPSSSPTFPAVTGTRSTLRAQALALIACAAAVTARADPAPLPAPRDRLRFIVQQQCLPHWRAAHDPAPCVSVDADSRGPEPQGYAVLADRKGGAHFLLIPTQTIAGIESPELRAPGALNFFDAAWQSRAVLAGPVGRPVPRTAVGLAVNQRRSRSQDQLHIHISCVRAAVARALRSQAGAIGGAWSPIEIAGYRYEAMRIMGERLDAANPFELLAGSLRGAAASMERFTLLVSGVDFEEGPGFVFVAGSEVPGAELLLDAGCELVVQGRN